MAAIFILKLLQEDTNNLHYVITNALGKKGVLSIRWFYLSQKAGGSIPNERR
jgi:hypothetical protein